MDQNVVIITGAAGVIGKATAKLYATEGAKLVLVDLTQEKLMQTAGELGLTDANCLIVAANVAQEEEVKSYVDQTIAKFGKIDIFVNNAGIEGKVQSIVETTKENLDLVLDVNVKGIYYGLKYVMPYMINAKQGSIINLSSVAGFIGSPGLGPYVASKHAILGIMKTAALEVAPYGVRVNAVCPGPVNSRMMESIEEGAAPGAAAAVRTAFEQTIPMGKYAEDIDIANIIYFLGSDKSKYITGAAYRVDGGMGAK